MLVERQGVFEHKIGKENALEVVVFVLNHPREKSMKYLLDNLESWRGVAQFEPSGAGHRAIKLRYGKAPLQNRLIFIGAEGERVGGFKNFRIDVGSKHRFFLFFVR